MQQTAFETIPLPHGIGSRFVSNSNGLTMHLLEAGFEGQDRPCVLLLPLAAARFHVIAPDQRGYGRTTDWDGNYDGDLQAFGMLNLSPGYSGAGLGVGLPYRSGRCGTRLRLAGGGLVCPDTAGCVPRCGAKDRYHCRATVECPRLR
jgi:hypothetical protein